MGGLETEIGPRTTNVLIESAQFDAMSVRRTSRALGLFSPSSFRFERPLDPEGTEWASRRCAELILQIGGGTLHPGVIDVGRRISERPPITLRIDQFERILGIRIDRETAARILAALGPEMLSADESSLTVRPPSWRSDLEREIDLIEEVARIHGYEHIREDRAVPLTIAPRDQRERVESLIRECLAGAGLDEAVTFSLVEERLSGSLRPGPAVAPLRVDHSSRRRESALRQSLVPSLLAVRLHNESHGQFDADLFEIANVYLPRDGGAFPDEPTRLTLLAGRDFLGLKGVVEGLLSRLHADAPLKARPIDIPLFAPGRSAELLLGDDHLGYIGEIDGTQLQHYELRESCSAAEIEFDVLLKQARIVAQYRAMPAFPPVVRDLSLVVAQDLLWAELSETVRQSAGPTLESLQYLDTFRGGNLPEGMQSVHFSMVFRHPERTLTGEEVEGFVRAVVEGCEARFQAKLRG
jgi:phenylalanyl-tRNA synthetase beta chain